jgi:membrane protease YdiL (CAAX protease family)
MRHFGASPDFRAFIGSTANYGLGTVAYIVLPALALRRVLRLDPWPRFFPRQRNWSWRLCAGLLLVAVVLFIFFAVEVNTGLLSVSDWNWHALSAAAWLRVAWVGLLVNIGVAIGEETIFRGYLLTGLQAAWGNRKGLVAMTIIFALFHLPAYRSHDSAAALVTLEIALAGAFGFLFGWIYLRTGTLWLPAALHFGWNFLESDVLNLTADLSNPNLIGALTIGHLDPIGLVMMEVLAFACIAQSTRFWLGRLSK